MDPEALVGLLKNDHLRRCPCLRQVLRRCGPLGYCGTLKDLTPQDLGRLAFERF